MKHRCCAGNKCTGELLDTSLKDLLSTALSTVCDVKPHISINVNGVDWRNAKFKTLHPGHPLVMKLSRPSFFTSMAKKENCNVIS